MDDLEKLPKSALLSILKERISEGGLGVRLNASGQISTNTSDVDLNKVTLLIEQEKLQLGHEIHDDICSHLTCLEMALHSLKKQPTLSESERTSKIDNLLKIINSALLNARTLTAGLNLSKLTEFGLHEALSCWVELLDSVLPMKLEFAGSASEITLRHSSAGVHIYRIAQEAIQNALKHAKATLIEVFLQVHDRDLILTVQDNGIGNERIIQMNRAGMGASSLHVRSQLLNAKLRITGNEPHGLIVVCEIPNVLNSH